LNTQYWVTLKEDYLAFIYYMSLLHRHNIVLIE